LDSGVITQLNGNVPELIQYFGKRDCINHVHFRNAKTQLPHESYFETFIDEGAVDMPEALRLLHETGYRRLIVPTILPPLQAMYIILGRGGMPWDI
jgi:mannonate dehydratase